MSTHGELLQHGKPQRRGAKPQPDSREGQAGPPGVADGLVVPRKPGNSGGGKGPEFKEVAAGEMDRESGASLPTSRPKRSRSEGSDPHGEVSRSRRVLPCPRAGCGKTACPVRRAGSGNGASSYRVTPRLYSLRFPHPNPKRERAPTWLASSRQNDRIKNM